MRATRILFLLVLLVTTSLSAQHSIARKWNELLLESIRNDFARPPVHARNLYHSSLIMYDLWAAFDEEANPLLLGNAIGSFECPFDGFTITGDTTAVIEEAISYGVYRLLKYRFRSSPGAEESLQAYDDFMAALGYDISVISIDYSTGSAAALGNYFASRVISFGLEDASNESFDYSNTYYFPVNPPLAPTQPGNANLFFPNRWQPLTFNLFVDQSGNVIPGAAPAFQSPEWGKVKPFSLQQADLSIYNRFGSEYWIYHDPGDPAYLDLESTELSSEYMWGFSLVSIWAAHLDPSDGVMWDISPASIGNISVSDFPTDIEGLRDFYSEFEGGDPSPGHAINPYTGEAYPPQIVPRADYTRVLAEFWADGPDSETPPGHWFAILNYVNDHPALVKQFNGKGAILDDLEWDVKAYLALGGAVHDAAISAWGVKGWYDYIRPISAIRFMADLGQSSDPNLPAYHPAGIPLVEGYVELVTTDDELAGTNGEHVDKIKLYTWRGPDYIEDPETDFAGVGWILAENWWPYQRPTFVTPPFAGYVSGHSTFSRAAAEVLTLFTGDEFFPGGVGEFIAKKNEFLVFEEGPSVDIVLQWATYRDASDQTSLSRIWGGIHPPVDDIPGRLIGERVGIDAFNYARRFFYQDQDNDGFLSYEDCDDNDPLINPEMSELCDGVDNNCNGAVDENLPIFTYYLDEDEDGFGDPNISIDTCLSMPPPKYVTNNVDCSSDPDTNPNIQEICDGVDNNCDGLIDEELMLFTYYLDMDGDRFGNADSTLVTCLTAAPLGFSSIALDCNDMDASINPNAEEICDGMDNNCNGLADEGLLLFRYYLDQDEDGHGLTDSYVEDCSTSPPDGYASLPDDCDDLDPTVYSGATEIPDNGKDEDCSGTDLFLTQKLFPNPIEDQLTIHHVYEGNATIRLYNMVQQLVYEQGLSFAANRAVVPEMELAAGMYVLIVWDEAGEQLLSELVVKL